MGRYGLALYLVLWLARCLLEIALKWLPLLKWMAVKAQVGHSHYKKEKKPKQKPVRANGRGARATAAPPQWSPRRLCWSPDLLQGRPRQPPVLADEVMTAAEVASRLSMNKGPKGLGERCS